MTLHPHELGDPALEYLAQTTSADHHRAAARGQRLLLLTDSLVRVLQVRGTVADAEAARADLFHVLADALYGGAAIDVPDFTSARSLDALRRGKGLTDATE